MIIYRYCSAWKVARLLFVHCTLLAISQTVHAANCAGTSVGFIPINDLGTGLYLNQFEGGLYPSASNAPPQSHALAGLTRAQGIQPLDVSGAADAQGKYVYLSIGLSNTTQEFCAENSLGPCTASSFMGQAAADPNVDTADLVIVNGAEGGQAASTWDAPTDSNYDRIRDDHLTPRGLSEAQVQAVWVKLANPSPSVGLPDAGADAFVLEAFLGDIVRALKIRYVNLNVVFFTSRIYAGYASTTLSPEPYAYESAFSIKWLIEAQINQMDGGGADAVAGDLDFNTAAPWLAWGPYLWADGTTARSDGLSWSCADLQSDGTHPADSGVQKVGAALLDFMLTSPFAAPWFRNITVDRTQIWIDGAYTGVEAGTLTFPYNSLAEGLAVVSAGGALSIQPGTIVQPITIDQPVTLSAPNGAVTIRGTPLVRTGVRRSGFLSRK